MLGSLIGMPVSSVLANEGEVRKYKSDITTGTTMCGVLDSHTRAIVYEVGKRHPDGVEAMQGPGHRSAPDMSVPMNFINSADLSGLAKRYSNFAGTWDRMDLAGVVERLGKAIAAQSVYGGMTTAVMRGGSPIKVTVLAGLDRPVSASMSSVFIPRLVDSLKSQDVFAVLAAAVNGEGSTVVTDLIALDGNSNAPEVPQIDGLLLAEACIEALRILGANYQACGAAEVFTYALVRGVHSVVSVVGHTDEGGYLRKVLRSTEFLAPYGGIHYSTDVFPGLPALGGRSDTAVAAWVDSIALCSAAAVAHCDPLINQDGVAYPSVFTTGGKIFEEAGAIGTLEERGRTELGKAIAADAPRFCSNYIRALANIFGTTPGSSVVAVTHLENAFQIAGRSGNRHLRSSVVAPYFWIEPTSLIPAGAFDTPAEKHGYAALVSAGTATLMPGFQDLTRLDMGSSDVGSYVATMPTARSSGLLIHLNNNPRNGLGAMRVRQMDSAGVVLPGHTSGPNPDVTARVRAGEPISSYLWKRGQSCLPAPAEFINTGVTIGFTAVHMKWDEEFFLSEPEHLPAPHEMPGCEVSIRASSPRGIPGNKLGSEDRARCNARTRAAASLNQARARSLYYKSASSFEMPTMTSAPLHPKYIPAASQEGVTRANFTAATERVSIRNLNSEAGAADVGHRRNDIEVVHRGPTAGPKIHMSDSHGPVVKHSQVRPLDTNLVAQTTPPLGVAGSVSETPVPEAVAK
jgi:hypothetical protein